MFLKEPIALLKPNVALVVIKINAYFNRVQRYIQKYVQQTYSLKQVHIITKPILNTSIRITIMHSLNRIPPLIRSHILN